jgi:hypothetical protein
MAESGWRDPTRECFEREEAKVAEPVSEPEPVQTFAPPPTPAWLKQEGASYRPRGA